MQLENSIEIARVSGFPPLWSPDHFNTPINASPYVVRMAQFLSIAGRWEGRQALADNLRMALEQESLVAPELILIGGSFMDSLVVAPNDIDTVWLYRAREDLAVDAKALRDRQVRLKASRVDARFIPSDGDPLVLVKAIAFFTLLYSKGKTSREISRGMLLLDLRESSDT